MAPLATIIDHLRPSFTGPIVLPGDPEYEDALFRFTSLVRLPAGAICYPLSASDVSAAVRFAVKHRVDLAVCGGGHAGMGNSSDGGLVIDMRKLKKVFVNEEEKTVTAQGGCLWRDVDEEAAKYKLACVGGTVNHTGVGGLTLGGGYGYLTPQKGLVIDNLLSATIVLANGGIVTASDTENKDLFWGIRGGGGNFGVAVDFTYRAHTMDHPVWGGILVFPPDKAPAIFKLSDGYARDPEGKSVLIMGLARSPPTFQPAFLVVPFFNGIESAAREFYKELLALGPVADQCHEMPYEKINGALNSLNEPGARRLVKATNFSTITPEFWDELMQELNPFTEKKVAEGGSILLAFEFFNTQVIDRKENSDTAFSNRGRRYMVQALAEWETPEEDEEFRSIAKKLMDMCVEEEKRKNGGKPLGGASFYANYISGQDEGKQVFADNFRRLQELKTVYDPGNIFNKWHKIPPLSN